MRIAYLTHSMNPKTGAGSFSGTLIDGLRARMPDARVSILTSEDLLRPPKWRLLFRFREIRRLLTEADVVHALDGFPYGVIAALALLGRPTPLIITAIGTGAVQKLHHPIWGRFLRWAYRRARLVTAPSRYTACTIEEAVPGLSIKIIHHGVETETVPNVFSKPSLPPFPYILSVGAWKPRKGHHVALRAFGLLAKEFPDLRYVLVGDDAHAGVYGTEIYRILDECGIRDRVDIRAGLSREQLRSLYRGAEAFMLLPQNVGGDVEGFGLVFLEAAAAGCPVVAGKGSGADDAVCDNESGFLVDSADPVAAADALRRLLTDQTLRNRMGTASRHFAETVSWPQQIEHYVHIYERF